MVYITRELQERIKETFDGPQISGLILAGIVGCGKTTLIGETLKELKGKYDVFQFTGDDTIFRNAVNQDTKFIHQQIRSQTQGGALVFVDEVQKSENIFDAIKYAFDESDISFIISGSNPDYLNTTAKKRLQRRADFLILEPFSMPEILAHRGLISFDEIRVFRDILTSDRENNFEEKINFGLAINDEILSATEQHLIYGGLPLSHLAKSKDTKLIEIQKVVERGFESISVDNEAASDTIKIELAKLHSKEFAYQGIFQKTGLRRRDIINRTVDQLINQGYLLRKKPFLLEEGRKSYLTVFSYIDPGIVTYLTGVTDLTNVRGPRIEGIIHARLYSIMKNHIPLKSSLSYYKPYTIDVNNKVKFKAGEIDFIFKCGPRVVPIEVKSSREMNAINVPLLEKFVHERKLPLGIVVYGGVPYWDKPRRILYWPFWLV